MSRLPLIANSFYFCTIMVRTVYLKCTIVYKNQTVSKKSIALLLRRYWFSSDDVKMKIVYFFMLSKIEVSTFQKINIFCHFEVHLGSKISENGYIANIGHLHLNCLNFSKLSCFMVFSHASIRKQVTSSRKI